MTSNESETFRRGVEAILFGGEIPSGLVPNDVEWLRSLALRTQESLRKSDSQRDELQRMLTACEEERNSARSEAKHFHEWGYQQADRVRVLEEALRKAEAFIIRVPDHLANSKTGMKGWAMATLKVIDAALTPTPAKAPPAETPAATCANCKGAGRWWDTVRETYTPCQCAPPAETPISGPDAAQRWRNANPDEIAKYRGLQIAIHPTRGIVASGRTYREVKNGVVALGLLGEVVFDGVEGPPANDPDPGPLSFSEGFFKALYEEDDAPPAETPAPTCCAVESGSRSCSNPVSPGKLWCGVHLGETAPVDRDASGDGPGMGLIETMREAYGDPMAKEIDRLRAALAAANRQQHNLNEKWADKFAQEQLAHAATTAKLGRAVAALVKYLHFYENKGGPSDEIDDLADETQLIVADSDSKAAGEAWAAADEYRKAFPQATCEQWDRFNNAFEAMAAADVRRGGGR